MRAIDLYYKEEYRLYIFILFVGLFFCYISLPIEKQPTFCFYTGILLLSMLCIYLSEVTNKKRTSFLLFWLGMAILGFPWAFRLPVAVDDPRYIYLFNQSKFYSLIGYIKLHEQEKGYLLLNWVLYRLLNGNYNHFQVIVSYLSFVFWGLAFRNNKMQKGSGMFMALFLWSHFYFIVLNASLVRLFLAIPIVLIAMQFIWKNKWKLFVIMIIFAASFHLSALVMLLFLFFLYKQKFFYEHWIFFAFLTFFIVLSALVFGANYVFSSLGDKYQGYARTRDLSISMGSFTTLPIWIACYMFYKEQLTVSIEYKKRYIIGMILLSLSIVFSIATTVVHVGRIIFYAYLGLLIVISSIFQLKTRNVYDMFLKCLLVIYPLVYVMVAAFTNSYQDNLFPYKTFLLDEM